MTLYSNDFSTANATGLGADWVIYGPATPAGYMLIADGGVAIVPAAKSCSAYLSTAKSPATADSFAQVTIAANAATCGLLLRSSDNTNTTSTRGVGYALVHSGGSLSIQKRFPSAPASTLKSANHTRAVGQVLRFVAQGSTLTGYVDGVAVVTVTDTAYATAARAGLSMNGTGAAVDDFYAGTLAEMAGVPTGALGSGATPGKVTALAAPAIGDTSVALTWAALRGANAYLVEYRLPTSSAWMALPVTASPAAVLTDLRPAATYQVRVTGRNAVGLGAASETLALTTNAVVLRTVSVATLDDDDHLPEDYMPTGYSDLATQTYVDETVTARAGTTDAAVASRVSTGPLTRTALNGSYAQKRPVSTTTPDRAGLPTVAKFAGNPVMLKSATGLRDIYFPCMIRVPEAIYAAYPQYGRWRIYLSTDHDASTGQIGVLLCDALNPDDPGATWRSYRDTSNSAVMFTEGGSTQTETPCVVWNPRTGLFHMYYQVRAGTFQTTKVATSPDGVTNWTIVGVALPNPPSTVAGYDHTGYAKVWLIDGVWGAWSSQGSGVGTSSGAVWWSYDGLTFIRDPRRMRGNLQWTEGTFRTAIAGLLHYRGQYWITANATPFTSGATTAEGITYLAPINPNLRTLRGRPNYVDFTKSQGETMTPSMPFQWAPGDDGRLWGAYHSKAGSVERISLAVIS